jgi:hypothetical protein
MSTKAILALAPSDYWRVGEAQKHDNAETLSFFWATMRGPGCACHASIDANIGDLEARFGVKRERIFNRMPRSCGIESLGGEVSVFKGRRRRATARQPPPPSTPEPLP